jgi:iron complex transport system ATP-binding protein
MIEARKLSGGYKAFNVRHINLTIRKGEFFVILGPNGSGKSTLLKLLTGVLPPTEGEIYLKGKSLHSYTHKEKAKMISVLGQEEQVAFDFTVEEVVALGRYPHQQGWFGWLNHKDRQVIEEAMSMTHVDSLRHHPFHLLSGGEKQRVWLAKALAQETECIFLDEPTNHLDLKFTFDLLDVLKTRQASKRLTVVAILHDLNVAALYADRVALMKAGRLQVLEDIRQLNEIDQLEKLYGVKVCAQAHPRLDRPQFMLTPEKKSLAKGPALFDSYHIRQNKHFFHLASDVPIKVMSNSHWRSGICWAHHLCQFYFPHRKRHHPEAQIKALLDQWNIPAYQTVSVITEAKLEHYVVMEDKETYPLLVVVSTGEYKEEKLVDRLSRTRSHLINSVNVIMIIDGCLDDGALVQAMMTATKAKNRAVTRITGHDAEEEWEINKTGTDAMMVAATQRGKRIDYVETLALDKAIERLVYTATQEALLRSVQVLDA